MHFEAGAKRRPASGASSLLQPCATFEVLAA